LAEAGLVRRVSKTLEVDREALLDAFLAEYRGPGGHESCYYSLESLQDIAARFSMASPQEVLTSADIGPDLLVPWRNPTVVVLYARAPLVISRQELVEVEDREDANVILPWSWQALRIQGSRRNPENVTSRSSVNHLSDKRL